jgi:putative transposase
MPRQSRLDAPGLLQHVMARGIDRCRIFRDPEDYEDFLARLETLLGTTQVRCYAWTLLPNHFHLLLRSSDVPLSRLMRCLMTGYAVAFNRRYKRNGHLFQNRYKSVICEDEPYLLELIRYIHLNPVRAGIVKNLSELNRYPWTGHGVLMGRRQNVWQEEGEVLGRFSGRRSQARLRYLGFMKEGMNQGEEPDFEGGGRTRSSGAGESPGDRGDGDGLYDERVLGGGGFVEKVLKEAGVDVGTVKRPQMSLAELVEMISGTFKVDVEDFYLGRRKREVSSARALVSYLAVHKMGYRFSEVGEALRVHPVSVARSLEKGKTVYQCHPEACRPFD